MADEDLIETQPMTLGAPVTTPGALNELVDADIEGAITREQYHTFAFTALVVCCLTLANGTSVTGEWAANDPVTFDSSAARREARGRAKAKVWLLEGYRLKDWLRQPAICRDGVGQPAIRYSPSELAQLDTEIAGLL